MSTPRGIPSSRAYWELRAEQMLNGLFSPQPAIEVEVCDLPGIPPPAAPKAPPPPAPPAPAAPPPAPAAVPAARWRPSPMLLACTGLGLLAATSLGLLLLQGHQNRQALRQERDLLLLERLRALGPARAPVPDAGAPPAPDLGPAPAAAEPPPPDPDWIVQLPTVPAPPAAPPPAPAPPAAVAPPVPRPLPPPPGSARAIPPLPQLVGVVQIPGRPAAAIFQQGGGSTTVAVGERIAGSGWRLRSADADGAVVEWGSQQRRLSLGGGG